MANPLRPIGSAIKASVVRLRQMVFNTSGRWGPWYFNQARGPFASQVGDGRGGSIVEPTLRWIGRNFSEAKPRVRRPASNGELEPVTNHELVRLLRRPNPAYSGMTLWQSTVPDWKLGDAYWYKVRSQGRRVVELWWLPSCWVEPRWPDNDPSVYIGWYDYTVNGQTIQLDPRDVVHFRNGIDPNNTRKGRSDIACVLNEVFTDDEAARWVSALLSNMGTPGALISPMGDGTITPEDGVQLKQGYIDRTTGNHRGEPLIVPSGVKVDVVGLNPQQMDVRSVRQVAEERITAALGPPAIVVGMGAGLARSTFANFREAREAATEAELIPDWRFFAEEIQAQLLPDFDDATRAEFDFDLSEVRTLQDDQNALYTRLDNALTRGAITLNQSLAARGMDTLPNGDVFYLPINVTVTPVDQIGAEPPPPPPAPTPPDNTLPPPAKMLDLRELPLLAEVESKADGGYVPAIHRLRDRLQTPFERQITRYLAGQQMRVVAGVRRTTKGGEEVLDWNEEQRHLEALFYAAYRQALDGTHNLAQDALGTSFEIDDPLTRAYLQQAGVNIVGITETTQRAISHTLQEGQALGEGVDELAARIQSLTQFSDTRARVIARTELGQATNRATLTSFGASGVVVGVMIHDGVDHEPCAGLNGRTMTLAQAAALPALSHPNCTRALAPLTRASQLESASRNGNGHHELVGV